MKPSYTLIVYYWPSQLSFPLKYSLIRASPYQSAMSMLNFYINRAGHNLSARQKQVLEQAKTELRQTFGKA